MTELRRVGILQAGKVGAILYGFFGLIFLPFAFIAMIADPAQGFVMFFMALLYPILGFLGCVIAAALYNVTAKFVGGLRLEFEQVVETPRPVAPAYGPDRPVTTDPGPGGQWRT